MNVAVLRQVADNHLIRNHAGAVIKIVQSTCFNIKVPMWRAENQFIALPVRFKLVTTTPKTRVRKARGYHRLLRSINTILCNEQCVKLCIGQAKTLYYNPIVGTIAMRNYG